MPSAASSTLYDLSHQIEHHMFPDLPAARYPEMAPRVREICAW